MRKLLSKTVSSPQGFTLIELLVVIVIIAILSIAGISIFSGTQKSARDSRRKADIESISKALEANYNGSSATPYGPVVETWFAGGVIPTDPQNSTNPYSFNGIDTAAKVTYTVCAKLEATGAGNSTDGAGASGSGSKNYYCLKAQQ